MQHCADHMDLISEHFYCRERPGLASHVRQMPDAVRQKAEAHRDYRRRFDSLKGKDIDIALDEWNYWYGPHVFGELGTRYFLKDALGVAAGIARVCAAERHHVHGQLRPDGQRDRLHQDHQDRRRLRHHRAGAEAVPPALRRDSAGRGHASRRWTWPPP